MTKPWMVFGFVALSGAAALGHQLVWTRRLVDVFGGSAETFARVLGAFFLGLSAGAWWAAANPSPAGRHDRRIFKAEASVAAISLITLYSPSVMTILDPGLMLGSAWKWLALLLVALAAVAMGMILPAVLDSSSRANERNVALYACNTLGGVLGIAGVMLWCLPRLGLNRTGVLLALINAALALFSFLVWPPPDAATRALPPTHSAPNSDRLGLPQWSGALGSGFAVLALEVMAQHHFAQLTINSYFSGAIVLSMVLGSLGLAAAFTGFWVRRSEGTERGLTLALMVGGILTILQPAALILVRPNLAMLPYELAPSAYYAEVLWLGTTLLLPMFLACGLIFPLLLSDPTVRAGGGQSYGRLAAVNGMGGWLGAEWAHRWGAPGLGLWLPMVLIGSGYLIAAMLREWRCKSSMFSGNTLRLASTITFVVLVSMSGWFARKIPTASLGRNETLIASRVGREGVVSVVAVSTNDMRMLFNNSYTLGGSRAQYNQERQALLPILLHARAKSVGVLGVATGSTLAGAALAPGVESIEAAELSGWVLRFAQDHFASFNRQVLNDPRVQLEHEDARWIVARAVEKYDVVLGDLFLPWRTGEGRLYSLEHFEAVKRSLKPGGVFCQWLPMFQLTRPQFETIARTFQRVFPQTALLRGDFYTELPILGLLGGFNLASHDWTLTDKACTSLRESGRSDDPLMRHRDGIAMMVVGTMPAPNHGPVNTLGNAWIEWDAGRAIVGLQEPWFVGVPCAEMIRDRHRAAIPIIPEPLRAAHDAGQFFLTLEIAAKINLPVLPDLQSQVQSRLPDSLRRDPGANWSHWPMRTQLPRPL